MAQPTLSDIHVNAALSNISIAYRNGMYIADLVFPQVPVDKQSDNYYIWTKDFWFRNYVQRRTPGDTYPEGALEVSNTNYFCDIYHLGYPIPDEHRSNQDQAIDLERTGSEWLGQQFMLNREAKMVADFFTTSVWGTDRTLTAAEQWSNFDSLDSDPIDHFNTAQETMQKATGQRPNVAVMGKEVWNKLRRHPQLLDMHKHVELPRLTPEIVAEDLEIDRIIVGEAVENTANEGATFSGGYMWGKSCLLLYVAPSPGLMTPSAGYTFIWPINGMGLDVLVGTAREDTRDRDLLKGKHAFDQKATATDLGYFIASAVA